MSFFVDALSCFECLDPLTHAYIAFCRGAAWHYQSHRVSYRVFVLICSTHQCSVTTQPNSHMSRYLGNHWQGFLAGSSKWHTFSHSVSQFSLCIFTLSLWFSFSISICFVFLFLHPVPFWLSFPQFLSWHPVFYLRICLFCFLVPVFLINYFYSSLCISSLFFYDLFMHFPFLA